MKCQACGYEHVVDYAEGKKEDGYVTKGDEFFIEILGSFHREDESPYGPIREKRVSLHACPKCSTVIMQQ